MRYEIVVQKEDEPLSSDNFPVASCAVRNRIRAHAYSFLITLAWTLALSASAQGLVGAPVDPRFGTNCQVSGMENFGFDTSKAVAKIVTVTTFAVVTVVTYAVASYTPLPNNRKSNQRLAVFMLLAGVAIPIFADIAGTLFVNNFGGMGTE